MFHIACVGMMLSGLLLAPGWALAAPIAPDSPTTLWTAIEYPSSVPDAAGDHASVITETDVVGDADDASFYTIFDDAGTPLDTTDGEIGYRVRVSGDYDKKGFKNFLMVGLDFGEDTTGDLDLFLGVAVKGRNKTVAIYHADNTANTSPATTSLVTPAAQSWKQKKNENYGFKKVDNIIDPGVTTTDFGSDGNDHFVSFVVPLDAIVTEMLSLGITVDENSEVRYVVGTGTSEGVPNEDLSGTTASWTSTDSWDSLGTGSYVYLLRGQRAPEPGTAMLVLIGLSLLGARRRRRP